MSQDVSGSASLRVALVTGSLNLGGSTTFLCNLGGELIRRKIPVEVLSFERENPLAEDFRQLNVPVLCQDEQRNIFEDRLQAVLWELSRFQPTVVLATLSAISFEVLRYLPAGVFRVGVGQADGATVYELMRDYTPWSDLLAVVSQTMKQNLEAVLGSARVPVCYLPYGVSMPEKEMTRKTAAGVPLRILYLGRLYQEQKRVRLFPDILDQLKSSGLPFHWTIAGEGVEKEFLERTMKSAPPHQTISFPGQIRYQDVPRLLREHDIFLLASDYEGLPLSLLEAMGHGLVPVVSDLPSGIPEVVNTDNGILVPVNDVGGYARAIVHLHEHRDELAAKSAAARARVRKEFSVEAMTDRWLAAFPKEPAVNGTWPADWKIKSPLPARHPVYYSPPMRALRRLAAKFRCLATVHRTR
jgi:glycosyltransferase involved in cell wall biosynthesis